MSAVTCREAEAEAAKRASAIRADILAMVLTGRYGLISGGLEYGPGGGS